LRVVVDEMHQMRRVLQMNDFTKEELEILAEAIPYILHKGVIERTELLNKIDIMINNYPIHLDISELETQTR